MKSQDSTPLASPPYWAREKSHEDRLLRKILEESHKKPTGKHDRFELEQAIMDAWSIVDDLQTYLKWRYDYEEVPTEDEDMNYIIGLQVIYSAKFDHLFRVFEDVVCTNREERIPKPVTLPEVPASESVSYNPAYAPDVKDR